MSKSRSLFLTTGLRRVVCELHGGYTERDRRLSCPPANPDPSPCQWPDTAVSYKRMTSYKRMKHATDTKAELLDSASQLFAQQGFKGTSVRAITSAARANLGAVTYHFGSKHALYNAVLDRATAPLRERLAGAVAEEATPLDRLESAVRAFFDHLAENPNLPRLMIQQLVTAEALPAPIKDAMQANIGAFASCIEAGQRDGSIRSGNPLYMALSIGSQPIFLAIARRAFRQSVGMDQDDPEVRRALVDSVIHFVRAGLAAGSGPESSEVT